MKSRLSALVVATIAALGGFAPAQADAPERRNFNVPLFEKVRSQGPLNVVISRGPQSVSASGAKDVLDRLEIVVRNGVLLIGLKQRNWSWRAHHQATEVRIVLPALRGVAADGSGNVQVNGGGGGPQFHAAINGSGDMDLRDIAARHVDAAIRGSGDIRIAGRANTVAIAVKGSGDVDATALSAATASIAVDGSGDVMARASRSAAVSINGSGDVTVQGTTNCQKSVRGSGDVTCQR